MFPDQLHNNWVTFNLLLDHRYTQGSGGFQFPFNIQRHQLMIHQMGDRFDLLVDGVSFQHVWDQGKVLKIVS